jgi:hypothetical protein
MIDAPMIDGCPVALGDLVSGPSCGPFSNGRVKGWSPCGGWLYVGWLGVVAIDRAAWACDLEGTAFARLYRPVTSNQWGEAVSQGWASNK